jgi:hypothetical protein
VRWRGMKKYSLIPQRIYARYIVCIYLESLSFSQKFLEGCTRNISSKKVKDHELKYV